MPNRIKLNARETIRFVNQKDHLFFCVEMGPYTFVQRAICPLVTLEGRNSLFTKTDETHQHLTAYFATDVPRKGKLTYGFQGEAPELVMKYDFEKNKPALLDRTRIPKGVVVVKADTFKRK